MKGFSGLALLMLLFFSGVSFAEIAPNKAQEVIMKVEHHRGNEGYDYVEVFFINEKEIARHKYFVLINPKTMKPEEIKLVEMTGEIPDGIVKTYYPNGVLMMETPYVNNSKNGKAKTYYKSGALQSEGMYLDEAPQIEDGAFKKMDSIKEYYEDGKLKVEMSSDRIEKLYYKDGRLKHEKDLNTGVVNLYDENGNIMSNEKIK